MKKILITILVFLGIFASFANSVFAADSFDQFALVTVTGPDSTLQTQGENAIVANTSLANQGIKFLETYVFANQQFHYFAKENLVLTDDAVSKKLSDLANGSYVYKVPKYQTYDIPNDNLYPLQAEYLNNIYLSQAWDITKGDKSVKIGVIDAGFVNPIPDTTNLVKLFQNNSNCPNSKTKIEHGSRVAQIIAANANNSIGIAGTIWNTALYGYETSCDDIISEIKIVKAIDQAIADGVNVVNFSLGASAIDKQDFELIRTKSLFGKALRELEKAQIAVVAASGNCNEITKSCTRAISADLEFPAADPYVISIGSVDLQRNVSKFSQRGSTLDLVAPGENIITNRSSQYVLADGTSFSAPIVTATIGLMKALKPNISISEIKNILYSTTTDIGQSGKDNDSGFGLLNVYGALCKLVNCTQNTPPPPACPFASTQARVQEDGSSPWVSELQITIPKKIRLGVFHNNSGRFANDKINIYIKNPNGTQQIIQSNKFPLELAIRDIGETLIDVVSQAKEGENYTQSPCVDRAKVTLTKENILSSPTPTILPPSITLTSQPTQVISPKPTSSPVPSAVVATNTLTPTLSTSPLPTITSLPTLTPIVATFTLTPSPIPNFCGQSCVNQNCPIDYFCVSNSTRSSCHHLQFCPPNDFLQYCKSPALPSVTPEPSLASASISPSPLPLTPSPLPSSPLPSATLTSTPSITTTPSITPTPTIDYCQKDCNQSSPFCGNGFYCHHSQNLNKCYNFDTCKAPDAQSICPIAPSPFSTISPPLSPTTTPSQNLPPNCYKSCTQNSQCSTDQLCISFTHNCSSNDPNYPECGYCYANNCLAAPTPAPITICPITNSPTPSNRADNSSVKACKFYSQASIFINENNTIRPLFEITKNDKEWYIVNDAQQKLFFPKYQTDLESGSENVFGFNSGSQVVKIENLQFPLYMSSEDKRFAYEKGSAANLTLYHSPKLRIKSIFCVDKSGKNGCPSAVSTQLVNSESSIKEINGIKIDCDHDYEYGYLLEPIQQTDKSEYLKHNVKFTVQNNTPTSISSILNINPCSEVNCRQGFTVPTNQIYEGSADSLIQKKYEFKLELTNKNLFVKVKSCPGNLQNAGSINESCLVDLKSSLAMSWQICENATCQTPPSPTPVAAVKGATFYRCDDSRANPRCCQCTLGVCAVDNLQKYFRDDSSKGGKSARQKAIEASVICSRESGCNTSRNKSPEGYPLNSACLSGGSCDYSVGPFQINLLLRCNGGILTQCDRIPRCQIVDQTKLAACRRAYGSESGAIQKMVELSQNGTNWNPWASKSVCNVR